MSTTNKQTEKWMRQALGLAAKAEGWVSPNPMVGAVVVKAGKVIGQGLHKRIGGPHAEVYALARAGRAAKGARLVVTLEPCCHFGRTPPCVDLILKSGVKHVDVAMLDPNPNVAGKGVAKLRRQGVKVTVGILRDDAARLNEVFTKFITSRVPWITLKAGITLDGYIAAARGKQQLITSEAARKDGHRLRASHDAIVVGIGTILSDNPELNCRLYKQESKNPPITKVVLDSQLRTPKNARIFNSGRTIIFTGPRPKRQRYRALEAAGAEIYSVPKKAGKLNLEVVLRRLGTLDLASLLVEGGAELITSVVKEQLADKCVIYMAPKLIGRGSASSQNLSVINNIGVYKLDDAFTLKRLSAKEVGPDLRIEGYFNR